MQIHFLNFEKKIINMAQNSTQITGIAFWELKAEKTTGNQKLRQKVFCQKFQISTCHVGKFQGPLEREGVEVGTLKYLPRIHFSL